ncbi:MAG: gamma carbonic anhydrase family protein [Gammaproteobacteria bacterium]|nr:MAG: gamma carbonic anhydrase family protein [Gammaproteobacteria bacterium]
MTIRNFENKQPQIHATTFIDDTALILGDVKIGEDCSIWPLTVVRGDVNSIQIGNNTNIQDNSVLHVTHDGPYNPGGFDLIIGNNVTVGHRVILHGCHVGDSCLIGMGSTVMDGATIESHTLIGAGSLVTPGKYLESGYLWMGSPARKIRKLTDDEIESIEYSAENYVKLKNQHQ